MFPILNPPPSPFHPSGSSQYTSPKQADCIAFLKTENRRQKRRQKKDLGFVSGCYLFEVRKPEHEPVGRKENV